MTEPTPGSPPSRPSARRARSPVRTALLAAAVVLAAVVIGFLLTPHGAGKGAGAGGPGGPGGGRRAPTVVGVADVEAKDLPETITAIGTVTAQNSVVVRARIAGVLQHVDFSEGQTVKAGQALAEVDPRPYQAALEQAQGQALRDEAALDQAKLDLSRYQTLAAQKSIAGQTLDQQAALVKQDTGLVMTDGAAVKSAKLNLEYCRITAPVSGRVGLRQVDPGNFVQTSDTNGIVVIDQVDPITIVFAIPEDEIPMVSEQLARGHKLAVTALDRTGAQAIGQGELVTLDNQIDTTTGTVKARARFANGDGRLYPNQFVNVSLLVQTLTGALTVPGVAVRHGPQGDFVYVVQLDSTVKATPVKTGLTAGETTQILSGVSLGDQVVTDGGDRLSDGARVVLPQDAAKMAASFGKPKPSGGFLGWLKSLFGGKSGPSSEGAPGASGAPAADGGSSAPSGAARGARMMAMLGALDLTPDQKAKAKAIFADARAKAQASDDPDARRAAMREAFGQVEAILTPEQKAKLAALRAGSASPAPGAGEGAAPPASGPSPAAHGPGAHRPPDAAASPTEPSAGPAPATAPSAPSGGAGRFAAMADALGLDPDQRAKAEAIFAAARAKAGDDPDARRAAMREAFSQVEALLTPDQKAKLADLRAARAQGQ